MDFYLQFGYGMMEHCRFLVKEWGKGTVVLSPRDLSAEQLVKLSTDINKLGGEVLLDPQLYSPENTNQDRLITQDYWPASGSFPVNSELNKSLGKLIELNHKIGAKQIILPGCLANKIDDDWIELQREVIEEAQRFDLSSFKVILTIALSSDALRNDEQVQKLLDAIPKWDVTSIYLVCGHPNDDYLISDPTWLANCADIVAGIRLAGKGVVVGYCNHQMLALASSAATAICSGTWMNVRSFNINKFKSQEDDEIKQRSTWYYAPQLLSEFKVGFLDIAQKNHVLELLETPISYGSNHSDELFTAPQPTLAGFTEQQAFRHYLQCLKHQTQSAVKPTFDETIKMHLDQLDLAELNLNTLHKAGIRGQKRDFYDSIDVNRGAIATLEKNRSAVLKRKWSSLII